ncbi:MAG: right-handed parallel beta-helix repeat-containing protein [bacterium]
MNKISFKLILMGLATLVIVSIAFIPNPRAAEIRVPADRSTIQSAIDSAVDGDVVIVATGTYYESITFKGKDVTVRSTDPDNLDVVASTIIDGNQTGSVVTFNSQEDFQSVLKGVTIQNGCSVSNDARGGGGISCHDSSPTISKCIISQNSASGYDGGGIHCDGSSPTISNCTISNNSAKWKGGGIYCLNSSPTITNCTISRNSANWGSGISCHESSPAISNCTIIENSANRRGGGIYCLDSSPTITNCTISQNSAVWEGGGIYCYYRSWPTIMNCILWGDLPDEINEITAEGNNTELIVTYSDIQGGYPGPGNMNTGPLFVDLTGGNYHVSPVSPCIDAGHPRIYDSDGSRSDMGAYGGSGESGNDPITITVSADGSNDFTLIQEAIDYALDGDTIIVHTGTYTEHINFWGKAVTVTSLDPHDPNIVAATIIDGGGNDAAVTFSRREDSSSILGGFTIQHGNSPCFGVGACFDVGGGISCYKSSPTITNCMIRHNSAHEGGGISCHESSPTISNCTISRNSAKYGGGIWCQNSSSPMITDCTISRNSAYFGSGISCDESSPTISNCTISQNSTFENGEGYGGGICCWISSSPMITNCIISQNSAGWGGGVYCFYSSPMITNCTISRNSAKYGGGISCSTYPSAYASAIVMNCILWSNSPNEIHGGTSSISYSDVQGGYTGEGNINADPLFVDANGGDYHLRPNSPCIDAGDPNSTIREDRDGATRPLDGKGDGIAVSDMGAYEYPQVITFELHLPKHWNMISLPVEPIDRRVKALFPDAQAVFGYSGQNAQYALLDPNSALEAGKGYWIHLPEEKTYSLTGSPIYHFEIPETEVGWSMIGACSYPSAPSVDQGTIRAIFNFSSKYNFIGPGDSLQPGKGYWINLSGGANITVE